MTKIVYNDFAPLAAENAVLPAAGSSAYQSSSELLNIEARELINYASFDADGIDLLDNSLCFAEQGDPLGYVSESVSSSSGSANVKLIITFENGTYSIDGLTVMWFQNVCTSATAKFYDQSDVLIDEIQMSCQTLDTYFEKTVSGFSKIVIDVLQTEMPKQFVKIRGIDLGKQRSIDEFTSEINCFLEISPDCSDLPGSTCDFSAIITDGKIPQKYQDLFLYDEDMIIGKFTVSDVTKVSEDEFSISCDDAVTDLEDAPIEALGSASRTVADICNAIYEASGIKIKPESYSAVSVSGFIADGQNARIAAAMLSFAIGKFISPAFSERIHIFSPFDNGKTIEPDQIIGDALYTKKEEPKQIKLIKYGNSFDTVSAERTHTNSSVPGGISSVRTYEDYSLMNDIDDKLYELVTYALMTSEIDAVIEWRGEKVGELVKIATKYDGIKEGIIKSMELSLAEDKTAAIKIATR